MNYDEIRAFALEQAVQSFINCTTMGQCIKVPSTEDIIARAKAFKEFLGLKDPL